MKLEQALEQTLLGKKIKLPEWGGYWYREDGALRVFCKNGDIVDTPNFPGFEHRTDWQVTEGCLGFDFAVLALKAGHNIRRKDWPIAKYISLHTTGSIFQYFNSDNISDAWKNDVTWVPNQEDLLAIDWEKVAVL